ncbi:hypothetical protein [Gordonia sp. (in: high G+C Gram-positive bacteria)]|jgi:predicted metal-dependent HD superfamily phosphohydrolase|uniref:HD domain-containing protein n=1 Tax=Gordonia sp. (in: high G+C Gram-positive bacteria) TaxID=84139 RepID=UPI001E02DA7E|nr:hypothetical protein [Gordonia sp. (in: high G+C Gram-positive bacteria)]MCB1293260.1 hypothetical protein [Gordonia sp. (in: high G+C Gram-positive bacteria)]HMS73855.1 hypothetical protein [Gordonia sp. (in: high G+C Gram-positive bacteria)]HQV17849.1 hypothetical protein [Gordonia sp. (in: high G+C Gram-positive bacteria)]
MDIHIRQDIRADLTGRWNEPHRHHHNRRHLDEVLAALGTLREAGVEFDVRPVVLAAWFHDAVYEPFSATNEEDSADLARDLLADDPDRDEVARLVELTKTHEPDTDDRNGVALSDADFAVLGADADRYDEYAGNIRAEFSQVPAEIFRTKRRELLVEFLDRPAIFVSEPAHERWETMARANIAREIDELR